MCNSNIEDCHPLKPAFVILHNGLKDQCGHYFETSMALAEAAHERGLRAILATHVSCPIGLFPDWLEVYPLFCTDHWMGEPPAPSPDLGRLRIDPYERRYIHAGDVREGRAQVKDLLHDRFHLSGFVNPLPSSAPTPNAPPPRRSRLAWLANRLAYYLMPPAAARVARAVGQVIQDWTPPVMRGEGCARLIQGATRHWRVWRGLEERHPPWRPAPFQDSTHIAQALAHPLEGPLVARAQECLTACNLGWELIHSLVFKRDLERLIAVAGLGPRDHVLLGTAHSREVLATALVVRRVGEHRAPLFHFEFRHAVFPSPPRAGDVPLSAQARCHKPFFDLYREFGPSPRMRFYTDTQELSYDYGVLAGVPFGVLPLPFRTRLMAAPASRPAGPLVLAYIGEARDEKGFPWLPMLIDWLMDSHIRTGKVRFLVQDTLVPRWNPQSCAALEMLRRYPPEVVQLVGDQKPLTAEAYYGLVSAADVVLLPYDKVRYRASSSGTLAEALAAGHPVVVPEGTWLAAQVPEGGGETFQDFLSFVAAVQRVVDNFPRYRAAVEAGRAAWLARHTPRALIETLLAAEGSGPGAESIAA